MEVRDAHRINIDIHYFLQNFFLVFSDLFLSALDSNDADADGEKRTTKHVSQYKVKRPFYLTGESYAGHYIASLMDYIFDRNEDNHTETAPLIHIPLSGAAIGNGSLNKYYQYGVADMAYAAGLIDMAQREMFNTKEHTCQQAMEQGELDAEICQSMIQAIVQQSFGRSSPYVVSAYDTRVREDKYQPRSYPPGHKDVEMFLGGRPGTDGTVSMVR